MNSEYGSLSASQHREDYVLFYRAYITHSPASAEAERLSGVLSWILAFGKISDREAAQIRLDEQALNKRVHEDLRETIERFQEQFWGQRGVKVHLSNRR